MPSHLHGLVKDAAVFPPGSLPLAEAVAAHARHRAASYGDLVGPLVVTDAMLPDLPALVPGDQPLGVAVVVAGGAGALLPAVRWTVRSDRLGLRGLDVALRDSATGEVAHNARRIVTAVDQLVADGELDDEVPVHVEPPRLYGAPPTPDWLGALDEIAAMDHRLKLRTGGPDADAFPSALELATCIGAALDRELAFTCTAGLHRALRHRDPDTGLTSTASSTSSSPPAPASTEPASTTWPPSWRRPTRPPCWRPPTRPGWPAPAAGSRRSGPAASPSRCTTSRPWDW